MVRKRCMGRTGMRLNTAGTIGLNKHKLCPVHGAMHLLVRDPNHPGQTGMCAHPQCLGGLLNSLSKIKGGYLIRFCQKLDADRGETGEFEYWVVEALLKEAKRGKPTVLNPFFMRWTCLSYLQKLKVIEQKEAKHREILQQIDGLLEEDAAELLETMSVGGVSNAFMTSRCFSNPEKLLAEKEFVTLFIEEWGKEVYLHYMEELSALDFMRITKMTPANLRNLKEEIERWVKVIHKPNCK